MHLHVSVHGTLNISLPSGVCFRFPGTSVKGIFTSNEPLWKLTTVLPGNGSDVVVRIAKCFPLPDNTESVLIRHLFKQLVEKLEEILDFPLHLPFSCLCVCICCLL